MIKLVIFDLDGVLISACDWHRLALNKALRQISNYEITKKDHDEIFNGIPTKVKLARLVKINAINENDTDRISALKQLFTTELINELAIVRDEKVALFSYLKLKNIKIACYTNSIRDTAELMLDKTGVLHMLDLLITNQDVDYPKPHPEGYHKILEKLSIQKEETIIVEDSPNGFEAAYKSGCMVFKVNDQESVNIDLFKGFI